MKTQLLIVSCLMGVLTAQAQFFSSTEVYIGSGATVAVNAEVINQGSFKSEGVLHLRKGLNNEGQMALNGEVILDGTGTQFMQSANQLKVASLLLNQSGKVALNAPMLVQNRLTFGRGIVENTEHFALQIGNTAEVTGASDRSHVKGYVQKQGESAFVFPVGDGSKLHAFAMSQPATYDDIAVGFVSQNPTRLSANRSHEVADVTANNYWAVQSTKRQEGLQVSVASEQNNDRILQLRNNEWNLSASSVDNALVSTQTVLNGASYFTIGTQSAESMEQADVSVYPNPSTGSFDVRLKGFGATESITLDITDLNGRSLIKQAGKVRDMTTKHNLGQEVPSGSYFLRVLRTEKNETFVQKLLIVK